MKKTSTGTAALVLGILSCVLLCGPFLAIPAIIVGNKNTDPNEATFASVGRIFALVSIILFIITVVTIINYFI